MNTTKLVIAELTKHLTDVLSGNVQDTTNAFKRIISTDRFDSCIWENINNGGIWESLLDELDYHDGGKVYLESSESHIEWTVRGDNGIKDLCLLEVLTLFDRLDNDLFEMTKLYTRECTFTNFNGEDDGY